MDEWNLIPFTSFGTLRFGCSRKSVRDQLGDDFKSFRKTASSINETDVYDRLGIHLYFDADDYLNFVEAIPRNSGNVQYSGIQFFGRPLDDVISDITGRGMSVTREPDGCYFPDIGVSIFAPNKTKVESVGVFAADAFLGYLRLRAEIAEKRRLRAQRRAEMN